MNMPRKNALLRCGNTVNGTLDENRGLLIRSTLASLICERVLKRIIRL